MSEDVVFYGFWSLFVTFSAAAGFFIAGVSPPRLRWLLYVLAALVPVAGMLLWGFLDGCFPDGKGKGEQCFGFGFGLVLMAGATPLWVLLMALGRAFRRYRLSHR
jgi:hypothetical protein